MVELYSRYYVGCVVSIGMAKASIYLSISRRSYLQLCPPHPLYRQSICIPRLAHGLTLYHGPVRGMVPPYEPHAHEGWWMEVEARVE